MFVVLPPGFDAAKKYPLVQVIHGGPHGISGDQFHPRWNAHLFAAPGYVVAMVNFHGSTSWGQEFAQCIQGAWGDYPFDRHRWRATDVLIATGLRRREAMAIDGRLATAATWCRGSAAHTDRFSCIVNHAGVYDTQAQYASDVTQGRAPLVRRRAVGRARGDRPLEPGALRQAACNTPMLVVHGERDYRVPVDQGLECYNVLKAKGVPARLVYFPDENHWVLKPRNSLLLVQRGPRLARALAEARSRVRRADLRRRPRKGASREGRSRAMDGRGRVGSHAGRGTRRGSPGRCRSVPTEGVWQGSTQAGAIRIVVHVTAPRTAD